MTPTDSHLCLLFSIDTATTEIYTLSLHDALPILVALSQLDDHAGERRDDRYDRGPGLAHPAQDKQIVLAGDESDRSEEHTSELQSHSDLVCRLLLEKKKLLT